MSKITLDNLSDNLKSYLEGLGLSEEQVLNLINENGLDEEELKAMLKDTMSINELNTNNKTVIGAINELFQSANNGKELIANAIGEPVSAEDTFSAMSSDINSLLSTFKTNMMNNGITVESSDKFKQLIDKIATMVEEGEGKGIQFASGDLNVDFLIAPSISNSVSITYDASVNFGFKPSLLLVSIPSYAYTGYETSLNKISGVNTVNSVIRNIDGISKTIYMLGSSETTPRIQVNVTNVTENGFNISATRAGTQTSGCYLYLVGPFTYYAIGVGEEDTTLRDSLASILQEEGVSVTEEDDMASLISKVDEEFDRKNNEIENSGGLDIISATELPATGKENQICVITNKPVNGFKISSNYSDVNDTNSNIVGITGVKNYGGEYHTVVSGMDCTMSISKFFLDGKAVPSYIYKNNNWEQLTDNKLYLFKSDYVEDPVLPAMTYLEPSIAMDNYTNAALVTNDDGTKNIYFQNSSYSGYNSYYRGICSMEMIDFSKYNTVEVSFKAIPTASAGGTLGSGASFTVVYNTTIVSRDDDYIGDFGTSIGTGTITTPNVFQTATVDISKQTGKYYLVLVFGVPSAFPIYVEYICLY